MSETNNLPVKEYRASGVRAAIWKNEVVQDGETRTRHTVRFEKSYRDRQTQEWVQTNWFFANDLPKLRLVVEKAYEFITLNERQPDAEACPVSEESAMLPE